MKKLVLVLLIGLLAGTAAFADHEGFGIGVVGGGGWSGGGLGWGALSLKIEKIPIFWAFSIPFSGRVGFSLGVSGDYYIFDKNLVSATMTNEDGTYDFKLDWYFGVGAYFNVFFFNDYWDNYYRNRKGAVKESFDFGLRAPVGLSWHIIEQLELFLALVPGFGFWIGPVWEDREYKTGFSVHPVIGGEIGFRVWFL
jgi:hypothetical protein